MNLKKSLLVACCIMGLSSNALAEQYAMSEREPFITSGKVLLVESTERFWIQVDQGSFDVAKRLTSSNNYRGEINSLLINAFGVNSEDYRYSASHRNQALWLEASNLATAILADKTVDLYCTETTSVGTLNCLVFGRQTDKDGKEQVVGYNRTIFEAGLSKYKMETSSKEPVVLGAMEKVVVYSQEQAKKNKAGVWERNTDLLNIEFEQ